MADSSFDIEATIDHQEVDNALNQAIKEVLGRFDFKGTDTMISWEGDELIKIVSATDDRVDAALDVLKTRLVRRKVTLKGFEFGDHQAIGQGRSRLDVTLRNGMTQEVAKEIIKVIKASKLKVTPANQGDKIRVTSKSRDDLQEAIALVKAQDFDAPLVFSNYR